MDYAALLEGGLSRVRAALASAAERAGRSPDGIRIVAVTKGHPDGAVEAALAAGLRDLGENRISGLEVRAPAFQGRGIRWHMVGHLQRRKAQRALDLAHLIHSVDSSRLAERLSRLATEEEREVDILLQVNTSREEAKSGIAAEIAEEEIGSILSLEGIRVRGLMTMAPLTEDQEWIRATFARLRELSKGVREHDPRLGPELSMGMTNDYEVAVEEGSTMLRLGTALFGERPT